jgi:nucleoside phosphorylase
VVATVDPDVAHRRWMYARIEAALRPLFAANTSGCRDAHEVALRWRTARLGMLAVAVLIVAAAALGTSAQTAAACSGSNHCYGRAILNTGTANGSGFHGAAVVVRTNCMYEDNPTTEFITNAQWVVFPDGAWIEAGDTIGPPRTDGVIRYY